MIPESLWRKRAEEAEAALATYRALMPEVRRVVRMQKDWMDNDVTLQRFLEDYECKSAADAEDKTLAAAAALLAKLPAEDKPEYLTTAAKCHSHEHPAGCGCHDGPPEDKPATAEPVEPDHGTFVIEIPPQPAPAPVAGNVPLQFSYADFAHALSLLRRAGPEIFLDSKGNPELAKEIAAFVSMWQEVRA
jgi:hypothetical protein